MYVNSKVNNSSVLLLYNRNIVFILFAESMPKHYLGTLMSSADGWVDKKNSIEKQCSIYLTVTL